MANRYPLILDTTDGNKIKELPEGDNLYLRTNSITGVQNIDALGTINAADITIGGQRLVAQSILDLTDTPSSFSGQANQLLKVSSDETSIDFVSLSEIGDITAGNITITGGILPDVDGTGSIGSEGEQFNEVRALDLYGNLRGYDGTLIFNASANAIPYAAIAGGPNSLSEFINDTGFVTQAQVDATLASGITISDFKGSVFGDDSTLLVDAVASRINPAAVYGELGGPIDVIEINTPTLLSTNYLTITTEGDLFTQVIDIEPGGVTSEVNITAPNITITGNINNRLTLVAGLNSSANITAPTFTGDFIGSVFADDSTILFDATDGKIKSPTISGTATFEENIVIQGNLTVQGTTTSVETTNTTITDNIIVLNNGEVGAGVTNTTSGIEIDRGSEANKTFVWDDSVDKWTLGSETLAAGRFESVGVAASVIDSPLGSGVLQIKAGAVDDTGNVIFINPYGSDTFIISRAETHTWNTGPYLSAGNPYIDFKTAGAFKAHDGAYFDGNLVGDVRGSVFGDDSTVIVDAINNNLNANTLNISTIESAGVLGINPLALSISSQAGVSVAAGAGPLSLASDGSAVYMTGTSGAGSISYNDANGAIILVTTGLTRIEGAAGGNINIGTGTSGTVTLGNGTNTVDFTSGTTINFDGTTITNFNGNGTLNGDVTGDLRGSVFGDDSTIIIDGTNNTVYGTFVGDIVGDMTGDPVLTLATPGDNPGEIINIAPGGSANFVNLVADTIRFFGNTSAQNNLTVLGTLTANTFVGTGDLTGSVFGDDSTILVDGVNNIIPSANISGTEATQWSTAFSWGDHASQGYLTSIPASITTDITGSLFADNSTQVIDGTTGTIVNLDFRGQTGNTPSTPGSVDSWLEVTVNGATKYIPLYV